MQDRIARIDETSCTARPDHTFGSKPVGYSVTATSAFASCGHSAGSALGGNGLRLCESEI